MGRKRASSAPWRSRSPRTVHLAPRQPREDRVAVRATSPGLHRFWDRRLDDYMAERRAVAHADREHPEAGPPSSKMPSDLGLTALHTVREQTALTYRNFSSTVNRRAHDRSLTARVHRQHLTGRRNRFVAVPEAVH